MPEASYPGLRALTPFKSTGFLHANSPNSIRASEYESSDQYLQTPRQSGEPSKPLTTRESIELFQEQVDSSKDAIRQSLAGTGKAGEALRPKVTIDLKSKSLAQIPGEVVPIIKQDVERIQLAHNQLRTISPDFASCLALKYLNLRDNRFFEVPQAVLGLSQLEILDLSQNYLSYVPDEISRLKSLRVFSINHNQIKDLPFCLGNISTLRILKFRENPLNSDLIDLLARHDSSFSPAPLGAPEDTEKEKFMTARVVQYLRGLQSFNNEHDVGPLETPRAFSRFPVHPNDSGYLTSGSESGSGSRSPGLFRSMRSHHRNASSQYMMSQNIAPRRPGLAPLTLSNDRNRSNSESVLQATQNNKSKRMGMVPKKHADLEVFDETKAQRNSFHLRGQSHNSALRSVIRAGDQSPHDDLNRSNGQNGTLIRRLSSVPEQRQRTKSQDHIIEGAKGILYSLHSIQPYLSALAILVKDNASKRSSLERYYFQASVQLENLDQSIHDFSLSGKMDKVRRRSARRLVCRATHSCVDIYSHIAEILLRNTNQLVADGDPKYVRTLMLLLYGSSNEERNARRRLQSKKGFSQDTPQPIPSCAQPFLERPVNRDDALTPTQEHPQTGRRWVNGIVGQHSFTHVSLDSVIDSQRTAQSHPNMRSRSNSRASSRAGLNHMPSTSSITSTPKSVDSFWAGIPIARSRTGSLSIHAERARQAQLEQEQFEKIYITLSRAAEQGLQVIPYLESRFQNNLEASEKRWDTHQLWKTIINRTHQCGSMSETLKSRLQHVKLHDLELRNTPDFWRLATRFTDAYGNLLASLREARQLHLLNPDLRHKIRPVHKSIVEAGTLIQNSPWDRLTKESQPSSLINSRAPTPVQSIYQPPPIQAQMMPPPIPTPSMAAHQHFQHRRPNGSNGSANGSSTSPYNNSVPATPLSAALGPAAQATVPTTPASGGGSMAGVFEGNVFQRADNLLLQGQNVFRRPGGAS